MDKLVLEELRTQKKEQTLKLIEAADVTRQIAEAAERGDHVAAQMLLGEREAPVRALSELEEQMRAYLLGLPEADAIRASDLLRGAEGETDEEKSLAEQTAQFRRLLETVVEMDKQLSLRLGGNRSFYKKFRE